MEEFNIQGKQTSFYKYCPGTFGYILVNGKFLKNKPEITKPLSTVCPADKLCLVAVVICDLFYLPPPTHTQTQVRMSHSVSK